MLRHPVAKLLVVPQSFLDQRLIERDLVGDLDPQFTAYSPFTNDLGWTVGATGVSGELRAAELEAMGSVEESPSARAAASEKVWASELSGSR